MKTLIKLLLFSILIAVPGGLLSAQVEERGNADGRSFTPFTNILQNTGSSFWGYNSLLHIGGIASTYLIIESDTDRRMHNYFARNKEPYGTISLPAVWIGYLGPLALGGSLYAAGRFGDDSKSLAAGCAVLQSSMIVFAYTSLLKAFTGRPNPDSHVYTREDDTSGKFQWGFMRNGIHYGWPSGHMGVSTAVISSLMYFYHDSALVKIFGGIIWSYMAFGVLAHEGNTMHWLSDIVAGSLMGFAIGSTVGGNFMGRMENRVRQGKENGISISPVLSPELTGLRISFLF